MLTTTLMAITIFGLCFFGLGIGFFIRGVAMKASCRSTAHFMDEEPSCGGCAKKEKELCPSDDETGLLGISQISNPHRTLKERPGPEPGYQV
ncbi:hypothetical protein [Acanthopleuribacter pedis]|uniref:Uncharacterized protein n=1 Tax=Acanthopleuribacter pedis TaxID=442870 RepID=A0A8J7U6J7_9BACT|nr:hypothetical protein [Acanthopleuribacter pedis]MBO1320451.1 hypothetical protein [Acanthopleuribacter pedis]